jgi:GMP synthase (glutamine-hydrolysing)
VRVLAIVHESDAGPGVFVDAIRDGGAELHWWNPADGGALASDPREYDAVLSFGGSMHPDQDATHPWLAEEKALLADLIERRVPVLGICLGAQLVAAAGGAVVRRAAEPEIGWYPVQLTAAGSRDPLLDSLDVEFDALEWHSYEFRLPPEATELARSDRCLQAFRIGECAWGIQFHAEVTLADFKSWLAGYGADPDAVRNRLDPDAFRVETETRIEAWNELGRGLCGRFLSAARARAREHARS